MSLLLTGPQLGELARLVRGAFTVDEIDRELLFQLDRELNDIVGPGNRQQVVFTLLTTANRQGWIADLIRVIKVARPDRSDVQEFWPQFDYAAGEPLPQAGALQGYLGITGVGVDPAEWVRRLTAALPAIGRIEVSGAVRGTAFLVGPQAVLTCQHVIRPLLRDDGEPRKGPPDTLVRFDLYEAPGGTTAGVPCPLAEKGWLLDALPPSALDEQRDPKPDPAADELDYALLKLNEPIADRTCLEPVEEALDIGDPLHILHYPGTGPLRLSLDTRAVTRVGGNGTRVRYRTGTVNGSSGSPCFDMRWRPVALHHATEPGNSPRYNQGVPFAAMLPTFHRRLHAKRLWKWLSTAR